MKRLTLILAAVFGLGITACKKDEPEPTPATLILGKWRIKTIEDIAVTMTGEVISRETEKYGRGFYTYQDDGTMVVSGEGTCLCPISGSSTYRIEKLDGKAILIYGQDWYADTFQVTILNSKKMVLEKARISGQHYHQHSSGIQSWIDKDIHKHITTFTRGN